MLVAAQLASACQRTPSGSRRFIAGAGPGTGAGQGSSTFAGAAAGTDAGREPLALIPAARCGECHGKMETEWRGSAHARADSSPLYRVMRAAAGATSCDRCHAPLRASAPQDPVAQEGVNCDACHALASVKSEPEGGASFVLRLEDSVRYGPLCDTRPHYFHTMGCSPLHKEAEFCAVCHDLSVPVPGGSLVVFPEFREWRDGQSVLSGQSCQGCHMPGESAEAAVGSGVRALVRGHGFTLRGRLLGQALSGQAQVTSDGQKLQVIVTLSNTGAGHAVPTGLPERRLQIALELVDSAGRSIVQEQSLGRVLVDAAGQEAPFFRAVRQGADSRLQPGESRSLTFELAAPGEGLLRLAVRWRPVAHALAQQLGTAPPPDEPMLSGSLQLRRRRDGAPATLVLRP